MSGKLGIFIIHGMGNPESSFADGLIRRFTRRLGDQAADVQFTSCYWSPILQEQQDVTWGRLLQSNKMDAKAIRKWVVSALGDPVCYLSGYMKNGSPVYQLIHEQIRQDLSKLALRLQNADSKPLMVLAHSLGSVIMSNYLWDEQAGNGIGTNAFEKGETLTSFTTYGSNIPMFLPPSPPITCIKFPSQNIPAKYKNVARWINVFDPDDILGYPLKDIWDNTQGTVIEDRDINVGIWPLSESPLSHTFYDKDDDFLDIVVEHAKEIMSI